MSVVENRALVERYVNVWRTGNFDELEQVISAEFSIGWVGRTTRQGRDKLVSVIQSLRKKIPDLEVTVNDVVAEGNKLAVLWTATGTQLGELVPGIPPSRKLITWSGVSIYRLGEGRILEEKICEDFLALYEQAGVIEEKKLL
jgi:steroid delta-isomerase-like uncharacterized protein